jgi:hypothetical protein
MTFKGVYWISVLAQRQQILVAPMVFLWIFAVHAILSVEVAPLTALLIGAVIVVYQQFSVAYEDLHDGFFDHCRFNGISCLSYAIAKSFSIWLTTLLPMTVVLVVFGIGIVASVLITSQWALLSVCIGCLMTLASKTNPLNLLPACLPLLMAPIIFLIDYLHNCNENSLLIFLGCDIILVCTTCLSFYFNNKV